MNRIESLVRAARKPIALTGAGISAPSGIPTFQGTWKGRPIREFLSRDYFESDRVGFFEMYMDMVSWCDKQPNAAHRKLAEWVIPVITQNIDGLHQRAGTTNLIELHGTLSKVVCPHCGRSMDARQFVRILKPLYAENDMIGLQEAFTCPCGHLWDTDVVLYGDSVRGIEEAYALAEACDLLLVIGSSLTTYPAAMLPDVARQHHAKVILINEDCIGVLTNNE